VTLEQPDAQRTQQELSNLLQHYPPTLRSVLALDPSLLSNQSYLAPYPALANFLRSHPEIERNPSFYVGGPEGDFLNLLHERRPTEDAPVREEIVNQISMFVAFSLAIGLLAWLIRTFLDYRRWNRLTNIQTDVHRKLLDRFTSNEDLLAYIHSPAGSRFLESAPITLDAGPRSVAGPMGRILWTLQGGVVLIAAGVGLQLVSARIRYGVSQPLHALGILGAAVGFGLVVSAIISFMISRRLGLVGGAPASSPQSNPQG
jgi:hypothetical protein